MSTTLATILLVLGMGSIGKNVIALAIGVVAYPFTSRNEVVGAAVLQAITKPLILAATFALAYYAIGASLAGAIAATVFIALTVLTPPRREPWEDESEY